MRKDSTGVKLGIAFGFLVVLLIGVGWLGLSRMGHLNADLNEILNRRWTKIELARQAVINSNSNYRITIEAVLRKHLDKAQADSFQTQREENKQKVLAAQHKLEELVDSEKERELLEKINQSRVYSTESLKKLVDLLITQDKADQAREVMANETLPFLNNYRDGWNIFLQFEEEQLNQAKQRSEASYTTARRLSTLLVLMAIALAIGMAVSVTRKLTREIEEREQAQIAVRKLNEDLEKKVAERTRDLARTVETLREEVDERKARERDTRRLAAIVEHSDDAIIAATLDGVITDWNAGAERMLGFSRGEMIGKPISLITPPDNSKEPLESQSKLLRGENVVRLESVRKRKDGKLIHVAITISPIKDQDGRMVGGSAILRDITERKLMEDALRRSESSFRSFVENAPYGILRTTPDGRIVQANPALVGMLGYASEQEVLGLRMATDVYRNSEERVEATAWSRKQDSVQGVEVDWKHKSGKPFTIRCAAHVVKDSNGNLEYLEGFVEDISERRAMELQLRQRQKMEAVGRLAGGVAHDFNNLLGVIIGYSELVLDQIGESSPLYKPAEQIKKAADRASSLTRQLLAFSRQQMLATKVLNLNSVVSEMTKMLPPLIGEDIELQTTFDPGLGQVKADQGQIEQVIMNLAVNARDAMPRGGRLTIRTCNACLDEEYSAKHPPTIPGNYAMLEVSDTGMGMDVQTQAHIFEPFFTTKEQGKGTGLGLATVYGFVKQSGGFVWVQSEPGAGATFRVYLPLVDEAVPQTRTSEVVNTLARSAETVLLVEDEESLRTLTRSLLEENGYTVLEAESGNEAVRIARQHHGPIHLLLTDMVMPGMNGRAVAENLTSMRPEIRVVYMSGYTGFTDRGLLNPDAVVISKPFTRDVLLGKLHDVLALEVESKRT
jgi:two-component system cell cycle sensor histidine kinase/response regulator CckA